MSSFVHGMRVLGSSNATIVRGSDMSSRNYVPSLVLK